MCNIPLSNICNYVDERVAVAELDLNNYISTENMLPSKEGITESAGLPTTSQTRAYQINDVLISNIRPYFQKIWHANRKGGCSNDVLVFRAKEGCYPKFLYYVLSDNSFFDYAMATAKGTKMPRGDKESIMRYIVPTIPYDVQIKIAAILSSLDAKIENNRAVNHHLEQIAQAIFKSWFVDFEPWGGKMPGDWKMGTLGDVCSYNNPRVAVSSLTLDAYISTENMVPNRGGYVSATSLPTIPQTTAFAIGDTLVSNIRPYFKKIVYSGFAGGCSTDVLCFRPHRPNLSHYVYNVLFNDQFFDYVAAGSRGTKMPRGDKMQIMNYHIAIPTNTVLDDFKSIVAPMAELQLRLTTESTRLAALRDALLPRLMSGEISVSEAEDFIAK